MSDGSRDTFTAFVLGALAGGVAALLMTPSSGPELRRKITESGQKLRDDTWTLAQSALEGAERRAREASDEARRAVDEVKTLADRQRSALRHAYEEGRLVYRREMEAAAESAEETEETTA